MIRIRSAEHSDLDAIRALLVETWHDTYDSILGTEQVTAITDDWHSLENLARAIGRPDHAFLLAEVDGRIAGTASATLDGPGHLNLDRIYVRPGMQRRGIGQALLAAIRDAFPETRSMALEVERRNQIGLAFYRKLGFRDAGQTGTCGGHGDSVRMRIDWT